ncbi:MAG: thioredoxin domain-containing protein [Deltaproteobacteria bacterium]|nr:thioredoxin domain-containing protein [Deltaproteobacteria bacterium]
MKKNRLSREASPYLRQHEDNPVDWYSWGDEALARAKAEAKPILLSIGYSACHWCHVMAHESFEDEATAAKMNELFVNVKVDREERPDLDAIYQMAVQITGRSGGWPLTVFLTPDQKPFFAGTYFPPRDRYGMPGFQKVLDAIHDAWTTRRDEVLTQADELTGAIANVPSLELKVEAEGEIGSDLLDRAAKAAGKRFDDKNGGFGAKPKFPNTMGLDLLLRRSVEAPRDVQTETRVKRALSAMRAGGVYDQLGGGFHRYSTDERWLVPHFEKMLYDNALLARLYVDAGRAYSEPRFFEVAHDVLKWAAREMTAANGAFFSTQDADSVPKGSPPGTHASEGAFFVWTPSDVRAALPADDEAVAVAIAVFGVTEYGNFEDPHHEPPPGAEGMTVLSEVKSVEDAATELGMPADAARVAKERAVRAMWKWREERPKPFRDEKILASWNGLMIGACAEVASATGDTAARAMAERAFEAIEATLLRAQGKLLRVMRVAPPPGHTGEVKIGGFLDDYAFLANAAFDLYEATANPRYAAVAKRLLQTAVALFEDEGAGGFFFAPSDGEALITRSKDLFDHAIPSGASSIAMALLRAFSLTGDASLEERARRTLEPIGEAAAQNPLGFAQSVIALDRMLRGSTDVVVVGRRDDAKTTALLDAVRRAYVPHRTLVLVDPDDPTTAEVAPALAEGKEAKAHAVAYVCRGRTCSPPVADATALAAAIRASA